MVEQLPYCDPLKLIPRLPICSTFIVNMQCLSGHRVVYTYTGILLDCNIVTCWYSARVYDEHICTMCINSFVVFNGMFFHWTYYIWVHGGVVLLGWCNIKGDMRRATRDASKLCSMVSFGLSGSVP